MKKNSPYLLPSLVLGDLDGQLDAAAALLGVDEEVLADLLGLPGDLARGLVVVELLDDETLGVLELLLGLEANRWKRFSSFIFCFFVFEGGCVRVSSLVVPLLSSFSHSLSLPSQKKKTKEEKSRLTLRDLVERVREAAAPLEDDGVADVGLDGPELLGGWGLQGRDAPVDDDFWFVLLSIGVFIDGVRSPL